MVSVKANDHWAFLEEIEAPMWADLTLEDNLYSQPITDEWFESSHIFHRCSSHELKSAFSHSNEKLKASERESVGASSPKLPSSVSRSRGKDFKRKNWAGQVENLRLNNQHPVNISSGSSPILNSNSARRLKPKSSYINTKRISSSKSSLTSESSVATNIMPSRSKTSSISENSKSRFNSTQKGESRTDSSITAESKMQLQQQVVEVSSKVFGQSNDLISIMRRSLRNSRVTNQASTVETTKLQISSSSKSLMRKKSSVGSCSITGCDAKSLPVANCHQKNDLEIRNIGRLTCSAKNKMKSVNTKAPAEAEKSTSKSISRSFHAKTGKQEEVKPKNVRAKALAPQIVDQRSSLHTGLGAKGKASYGGKNRVGIVGKENINGGISCKPKVNDKGISIGGAVVDRNVTEQIMTQRATASGRVNTKQGKPTNSIGRVYLR